MDNGSQSALTLMRLPHGGYVVTDHWMSQHAAYSSIDEALKFMRDAILPVGGPEKGE